MADAFPALMLPGVFWADWALTSSGWAVTYLLHSTVAFAVAWLLQRSGLVQRASARDVLWKAALLMGIITASVQVFGATLVPQQREAHIVRKGLSSGQAVAEAATLGRGLLPAPTAARSIQVEARVSDPSPECVELLRGGLVGVGPDVQRLQGACASAPWVPVLPWALLGFWVVGGGIAGARFWARSRALGGLLAHRELVSGGYAREVLDELLAQNPRLGSVALYRVEGLESPAALTRREIGLPLRAAEMPSGELRVAMAHEVAHLVRRDPGWMRVTTLISSVLFFQPLNRLAARNLRETAELLADDWAVERTGAPLKLARSLARVAQWLTPRRPSPVLAMAGVEGAALGRRVERILGESDRRPVSRMYVLSLSCVLFFALAWIPAVRIPAPSTVSVIEGGGAGELDRLGANGVAGRRITIKVLIER